MGTIIARKRRNGSTGYTAQIVRKHQGKVVWREAKTFGVKQMARAWLRTREAELFTSSNFAAPSADPTLSAAIDRYIADSRTSLGRTKEQVLRAIKDYRLAAMPCGEIRSEHIVRFAQDLSGGRQPQTVGNYISHLSAIFRIAQAAWGYRLDAKAMDDAHVVLRRLGMTAKSASRDRRPTLAELDLLMTHFSERSNRAPSCAPMHVIIAYAIFSTRRQDEIVRQTWRDIDEANRRLLVRDMKNPGQKAGNNVWCELSNEALQIIRTQPRISNRIFPYSTDAVSAAFTRACKFFEIHDLHFHDLRHDGISRLFEMGYTIPQVACISGHRSWQSLQRYTHLRLQGDKYDSWRWLQMTSNDKPLQCST